MNQCELCSAEIEGYLLCSGCARATLERLHDMPSLYRALAMLLPPASRAQGHGGTHSAEAPMPIAESVLTMRGPGGIVGVLEDWYAALAEDLEDRRGLPTAGRPVALGSIESRISFAVGKLVANLEFIAASWPAAGEFARGIRDLERDVLTMISPPERPAVRMGKCPATPGGVLCGAMLSLSAGETVLRCAWCRATYPTGTWAALRQEQRAVRRSEVEDDAARSPAITPSV
ncbi:hypothetical protein ACFO3J_24265 [Streptomyces polygonati]|uniref:Uncharacterized protein n=1 Tax=Streptomyces polygonati TaxID=1617087 RepID=A0ABV8HRF5_9ACTN